MTQLVLLLYEDPKADPLSEHRFHVELHFSPGAKTMDDPEFLSSTTPPRKASSEDVRSSASIPRNDLDVEPASKISKVDENTVMDSGHQSEDLSGSAISEDTSLCDLNSSSHSYASTNTNPGQYDTAENTQKCMTKTVKWTVGTSESLESNSAEREPTETEEFQPYDDNVYTGNELPRCAIGIDDYSDSALGASVDASAVSSSMSIDELPREEKVLTRERHSLSESELTRFCGVTCDKPEHHVRKKVTEGRRCKSDSDFMSNFATARRDITQKEKGGREFNSVTCIVEEDASEPHIRSGRPKSNSVSMIENLKFCNDSQGMQLIITILS